MAGPNDPSMEEILASIKKVIAEEPPIAPTVRPRKDEEDGAQSGPQSENDDVLELDEEVEAGAGEPDPEPAPGSGFQPQQPPAEAASLMAEDAAGASKARLEELAALAAASPQAASSNPMEEMVREMLRPMLKQWLDERLPGIVDDHVRREISRITGRKL